MKFFEKMQKKKQIKWIMIVVALVVVLAVLFAVYISDYYPAQMWVISTFPDYENVILEIKEQDPVGYAYVPEEATEGLIFYPGGKVDYQAYSPLLEACAAEGIVCVAVRMPFNLAVFDISAAEGIQDMYPDVENWYIGGHSLGGSMAASYLADNAEEYEGLILLGAYSAADLSETELEVLSIYGSEDQVLNREKYSENKSNLPDDFKEVVLEGGCHAYFGVYGEQEGDGTPTISNAEQIEHTVVAIAEFINK